MKVLVVLPFAPWPVRVRCSNLWPRVGREAEVHVVCLDTGRPANFRPSALPGVASMELVPFSSARATLRVAKALPMGVALRLSWSADAEARRSVELAYRRIRPDVVYAERLRAIPLVEGLPCNQLVLDPTDSLPLFYDEVQKQPGAPMRQRLLTIIERERLRFVERTYYPRFSRIVACSPRDAAAMRQSAPDARVEIVANGVDLQAFRFQPLPETGGTNVLMSGNFGYWPNREAAGWMLKRASEIRERFGGKLVFAGANPPTWMTRAGRRGDVKTIGFAPDLSVHYHAAKAVAAPIQFAVGSQNKVLEAMACGRPVVTTPQCAAGLGPEGRASVVAASRETFVDALGEVLADTDGQKPRAERGRAYVEASHSWDRIASNMAGLLARVAGKAA